MVGNLIVGGHDTTASQIGCSLLALLRHPEALDDLRADPSLAGAVVNETIRFEPSIAVVPRTLVEPVEIGGVERPAGRWCSSRRRRPVGRPTCGAIPTSSDRHVSPRPARPKLLSFGSGPHYCLGAALARMTLEEVVRGAALAGLGDTIVPTHVTRRRRVAQRARPQSRLAPRRRPAPLTVAHGVRHHERTLTAVGGGRPRARQLRVGQRPG